MKWESRGEGVTPVIGCYCRDDTQARNVQAVVARIGWRCTAGLVEHAALVVTDLAARPMFDALAAFARRRPCIPVLLYLRNTTEPESYANAAMAGGVAHAVLIARKASSDVRRLRTQIETMVVDRAEQDAADAVVAELAITSDVLVAYVRSAVHQVYATWGHGPLTVDGITRRLGRSVRSLERHFSQVPEPWTPKRLADAVIVATVAYHGRRCGVEPRAAARDLGITSRRWRAAAERLRNLPHPPRI